MVFATETLDLKVNTSSEATLILPNSTCPRKFGVCFRVVNCNSSDLEMSIRPKILISIRGKS